MYFLMFDFVGELIRWVFYGIFLVPVIIFSINLVASIRRKEGQTRMIMLTAFSLMPFVFVWYLDYSRHQRNKMRNTGTYMLTTYPDCPNCHLEILKNGSYGVLKEDELVERGEWSYQQQGDFWIVILNEGENLGEGRFQYDREQRDSLEYNRN